jgi:hypothetical protein
MSTLSVGKREIWVVLVLGTILSAGTLLTWKAGVATQHPNGTDGRTIADDSHGVQVSYGNLPLSFEANQGQTDEQVKFLSRGRGYSLFLTSTEAVLSLISPQNAPSAQGDISTSSSAALASSAVSPPKQESAVLRMRLVGANPEPQVVGVDELPGKSNYFIGNDPSNWRTNVPHYRKVKYQDVYPGIDLVYYGTNQQQLEYDFVVAPGADPKAITLNFEGADSLEVDAQGDLLLYLPDGEVRLNKLCVYQEVSGTRQEIAGGYVLKGKNEVTFEVATYDVRNALIVDPVLSYSTYLGGSSFDRGFGIAVDAAGSAYIAGRSSSTDFPTTSGAFQTSGGGDAFVTKLAPTGSVFIYSTYLGGSRRDEAFDIAIDTSGNAYVTGITDSFDFPTVNAFQPTFGFGTQDAFVAKLNPTGSALIYATYLGGIGGENVFAPSGAIAADVDGNAYVTGTTDSFNFPTVSALQVTKGSSRDAFVAKFDPTGSALYSTYLGGNGTDVGSAIAVDSMGNTYVAGAAFSTNFPITVNAFQPTAPNSFTDTADAFVTKLDPTGSALVYSTYLGGPLGGSLGFGIAVDTHGNAYVTGLTLSGNFPTTSNAFQGASGGGDAFVTKLDTTASGSASLVYSTYLGGSGREGNRGGDIAVDVSGNAYVTGDTNSLNFPTADALQPAFGGIADAFVAKVNPTGSALVYSTYLGGSASDGALAIAVDSLDNAYLTGMTASTDFPTANSLQPTFGGGFDDAFVAKIGDAPLEISIDIDVKPGSDPNAINPASKGLIPVAILSTEIFDALTISPTTVQFGPGGASIAHRSGHLEDVDSDGDLDLVLHFRTQEAGILCGDTEASLTGETFDGQAIQGTDSIVTVGCH